MPLRLRDRYLAQVIESLIQFAAEGGACSFRSEREGDELAITFTILDADRYHQVLSRVTDIEVTGQDRTEDRP